MPHEPTGLCPPVQRPAVKHCPACDRTQPVENFYTTRRGRLSGYCKPCQRLAARLSGRRREAAMRLLIAFHPEEWAGLLGLVGAQRQVGTSHREGGARGA